MSVTTAVLLATSGVVIAVLSWLGFTAYNVAAPTHGAPIAPTATRTALLVVDAQTAFTTAGPPYGSPAADVGAMFARIEAHKRAAIASGHDVIYVRQVYRDLGARWLVTLTYGGLGNPGSGVELDPRAAPGRAPVFEKAVGDALSVPELDTYLRERNVGTLWLAGLDGAFCVQRTANGALNRGYGVVLLDDAILTGQPAAYARASASLTARGARVQSPRDAPR